VSHQDRELTKLAWEIRFPSDFFAKNADKGMIERWHENCEVLGPLGFVYFI